MSILRKLFGPSQAEVWRQLCNEIGADFVDGDFWRGPKVVARVDEWTVTLDTYTVSTGRSRVAYTRLRAPYVNRDGFCFTIYRKTIFSGLGKLLGMQDIEMGDPFFDEQFIIKGNDEGKVRALFAHAPLRELIQMQPAIHLTVKDDERWFGKEFPEGVDELYFEVQGFIKDVARLKSLFELFAVTLHCLCHLGSAYEDDPHLSL